MAMATTRMARSLRLLSLTALLVGTTGAQTCYNTWGREDTNMQPCFAPGTADTNATTWCCSKSDHCLSNGLCLSPESNNLMTQQGCTDQNWGGACNKRCPASNNQNSPEIPLIPCPSSYDNTTNTIKFCCGPDASSCCSTPTSWLTIPTGTIFTSTTSSGSTSQPKNNTLTIGLGIGLGIGLPILLVLLAVAYLLLSQPLTSRHHNHHHKRNKHGKPTTSGSSKTEKSDDTSPTYPPRRKRNHRHGHHRDRHGSGSFGHVDTNIRPSTDSQDGASRPAFQWPPPPPPVAVLGMGAAGRSGHASVAAALARWARSPFGFHNPGVDEVPPSPKEMDGRGRGSHAVRSSSRWRGEAGSAAAELAASDTYESGVGFGVGDDTNRGWKGSRRVVVAAEEVELPTPDTPGSAKDVEKGEGRRGSKASKGMV